MPLRRDARKYVTCNFTWNERKLCFYRVVLFPSTLKVKPALGRKGGGAQIADLRPPHRRRMIFFIVFLCFHPVIRLSCNEAAGGRGEQLCVQNELSSSAESVPPSFTWLWEMLLGNSSDCSPQGFNTALC